MKDIHKLVLAAAICLPISFISISKGIAGMMPVKEGVPAGKPVLKRITTVPYVVSVDGKKSVAETWHGIIIIKTATGTCIRTERSRLNLVRDGDGFEPEYEEYRRVVPCSTESLAEEIWNSVSKAVKG